MNKYEEIKKYLDKNSNKYFDDFANIEDYYLIIRIGQMYRELESLKLSYERVLEKDFKDTLLEQIFQARQTLYNARIGNPRKQDLIDGINWAIEDLERATTIEKSDK